MCVSLYRQRKHSTDSANGFGERGNFSPVKFAGHHITATNGRRLGDSHFHFIFLSGGTQRLAGALYPFHQHLFQPPQHHWFPYTLLSEKGNLL